MATHPQNPVRFVSDNQNTPSQHPYTSASAPPPTTNLPYPTTQLPYPTTELPYSTTQLPSLQELDVSRLTTGAGSLPPSYSEVHNSSTIPTTIGLNPPPYSAATSIPEGRTTLDSSSVFQPSRDGLPSYETAMATRTSSSWKHTLRLRLGPTSYPLDYYV